MNLLSLKVKLYNRLRTGRRRWANHYSLLGLRGYEERVGDPYPRSSEAYSQRYGKTPWYSPHGNTLLTEVCA
jgi:hypothetical protein